MTDEFVYRCATENLTPIVPRLKLFGIIILIVCCLVALIIYFMKRKKIREVGDGK